MISAWKRTLLSLVYLIVIVSLVASCGPLPTVTPSPVLPTPTTALLPPTATAAPTSTRPPAPTATAVPPTATSAPTNTPKPTAPPTATPIPASILAAELTKLASAGLPPAPSTPKPGESRISAVGTLQLKAAGGGNLWAAFSIGLRNYMDEKDKHFVAIYERSDKGWTEKARTTLECPGYVDAKGLTQGLIEDSRIWLGVSGGVGAHGGCFDLLTYDGKSLSGVLTHQSPSPGMAWFADVNGDGRQDLVLDQTDPYVFCYACGVRSVAYRVMSWDGAKLAEVKPALLPDSAPAELRTPANRAVELAQARLWKDALKALDQALALKIQHPVLTWNAALIRLHAEGQAAANHGEYPLLEAVFYGDYEAALKLMRPYKPEVLFGAGSPLVTGTVAAGWKPTLTRWITKTTTLALTAEPNLAGAYFLRGWAVYLTKPADPAVLADITRAAQLNPGEALYADALAYLKKK